VSTATLPRLALGRTDAARICGVSTETLTREVKAGRLKAKRSGKDADGNPAGRYLFFLDDLRAWLDGLDDA
jgi:hypothetical protein